MMRTTDGKLAILDFGLMTEVTVSFALRLHIIPVLILSLAPNIIL